MTTLVPGATTGPTRTAQVGPRGPYERVAATVVIAAAALLYLWNLGGQGTANHYYAAAAQAGGQSWTAWFFGGLDSGGAMSVDKPPLSLWLMGLSTRAFGFSSWSLLVPQALLGAATVAVLYAAVRRTSGPVAALVTAAALAVTPVATLMSRYDNPDTALVFLLVSAAYLTVRVTEAGAAGAEGGHATTRWALAVGVAIGLAFLTKSLQSFVVLPALALVAMTAITGPVARRLRLLAAAGGAAVLTAGWWVAVVQLWPSGSRPYIGGSLDDSVLGTIFGLNGAARLTGDGQGPFGTGPSPFAGDPGPARLFNTAFGGQIAWLLPMAAIALVCAVVLHRHRPRTDPTRTTLVRTGYLLWGTWAVVHMVAFSFAQGIIHSYYALALAPAVAALVGMGAVDVARLARERRTVAVPVAALLLSALAAWILLGRAPGFVPWLGPTLLVTALAASALAVRQARTTGQAGPTREARVSLQVAAAGLAAVAVFGGPTAWSLATVGASQSGGDPQAGPARAGVDRAPAADPALASFVRDRFAVDGTRWAAAAVGVNGAAPLQLTSGAPVIMLGGFDGKDPGPPLARVQSWAATGELRYVVSGTAGFRGGVDAGDAVATAIVSWAERTGERLVIPGSDAVVYDVGA